ncbi:MAG: 3-methyl-2-oxobutanoate hydroxymethyltransferase [Elusimicrobia bacterium]|nr:3-methyl-2-oxobutanoate hydroxymethyltransferase [Elusimicrobiota bacterium]
METAASINRKVTPQDFLLKKQKGVPLTMLTAYDYPTALAVDRAGIDSILVGDSLGMVVLGYDTTLPVTMDEMIHHAKAAARGAKRALLIGDLPFLSYQTSVEEALRNAGRFIKEAQMDAIKLEGGQEQISKIKAILDAGIPVVGHLGLTPQSVRKFGGWKTQGKTAQAALKILRDAEALEEAGCFALVLESIPSRLAALISRKLRIPTIGIGAGNACDGQVLVTHDMLGLFDRFTPKFVRRYANLYGEIEKALQVYKKEVQERSFPQEQHSFAMPDEEWKKFNANSQNHRRIKSLAR